MEELFVREMPSSLIASDSHAEKDYLFAQVFMIIKLDLADR